MFAFAGSHGSKQIPKQPVYSLVHLKPSPTRDKPPTLPLSHTCRPILHTCTHKPSLLFSQTTMAISMRKANVRSQSTAARASAAPCGFPPERERPGDHRSDEGFMLSWSALFLAVLYHRLIWSYSISPSTTTDIYCPQSSSLNTPLGFRWREHQQQQVIEDWEQFSFSFPSWDLNHQLPDPTLASLTIKVGVVLVGCGAQTISQSTENVTILILPSLFCFLFK